MHGMPMQLPGHIAWVLPPVSQRQNLAPMKESPVNSWQR